MFFPGSTPALTSIDTFYFCILPGAYEVVQTLESVRGGVALSVPIGNKAMQLFALDFTLVGLSTLRLVTDHFAQLGCLERLNIAGYYWLYSVPQ